MSRDDLIDPWGGVIAGVAGGLAWALTASLTAAALPLGLGVAVAVYGVKVLTGVLVRPRAVEAPGEPVLPEPAPGSRAAQWRDRAMAATESLRRLAEGPGVPLALTTVAAQSGSTYADVHRLAGRIAAVEQGLAAIPVDRLRLDRDRLGASGGGRSAEVRTERDRALAALDEQLAVATRLGDTRDRLLARLQATALGLEGLVARGNELLAMSASFGSDTSARQVADLTAELEGLRAGLAETEQMSRRVLEPPGPTTPPAA